MDPTPPLRPTNSINLQQVASAPPPPPTGQIIAPSGVFPGSLTPGWNDPPPVSSDSSNNSRPRLDLRKRVAHPLDGKSSSVQLDQPHPPIPTAQESLLPRPVALVTPQRHIPNPDPNNPPGSGTDVGGFGAGLNANAMRLPPLAHSISIDPSKVAKVPPRAK
ncbi:GD16888 [Drosophila simulans]|uniref:GD16888 n=1 Tax=Drosophila simulans TaxID=7240 RepID=B4R6H0_DROSI|nr:GD16888 [Drosophila simulans]